MNEQDFVQNFADQFEETDISEITFQTGFRELDEWSSLLSLSIIAMCDEIYNVKITGNDIRDAQTVKDLYTIVQNRS